MLVGQRVGNQLCLRHSSQNLLAHLVHCVLHAGTLILGESGERNVASFLPRRIELGARLSHGVHIRKRLPRPGGVNISGQDAVPGLSQSGVLVPHEAVEGRAGALQHSQALDAAIDDDALFAADAGLDVARLPAVTHEAVRMRLALNLHAHPAVRDDFDIDGVDVAVFLNEVGAEDGGKQLRRVDGVLLGGDEDCVLDGVGGDDDAVVALCVGDVDVALEEAADGHFGDGVDAGGGVAVRLEDADIVLAVAGGGDVSGSHDFFWFLLNWSGGDGDEDDGGGLHVE